MPDIDKTKLLRRIVLSHELTALEKRYIESLIDAKPVKHGKWVRDASGELNCSYCGYAPKWDDDKFCANCGAKMDGGDADA